MYNRLDISELGKRIRKARKKKYRSQELFADALHVDRQSVQGWESGKHLPDLDNLISICELLDVDLDYLTGRIECETHETQFICDQTGLSEAAVNLLHKISSGDFFNAQIRDCIDLLLKDADRNLYQSVLIDIHNFIYADHVTLEDHRTLPDGSVCYGSVQDLRFFGDKFSTGNSIDHEKVIRETLQREIFDKLRKIPEQKASKKRNQ